MYRSLFCCKMLCFWSLVATNNSIHQCLPFTCLPFICRLFVDRVHFFYTIHHYWANITHILDVEMLPTCVFFGKKQQYQTTTIFSHIAHLKCTYQFGVLWVFRNRWKIPPHQNKGRFGCLPSGLCLHQDPSPVGRPLGVFEFLSRLDICFQQQAVAGWGGNFYGGGQQLACLWLGGDDFQSFALLCCCWMYTKRWMFTNIYWPETATPFGCSGRSDHCSGKKHWS